VDLSLEFVELNVHYQCTTGETPVPQVERHAMSQHEHAETHQSPLDRLAMSLGYAGVALALVVPVILQSWATELPDSRGGNTAGAIVAASVLVALAAAILFAVCWRTVVDGLGNQGLATIGMISGLHFAVSYASVIAGYAIGAVFGPFYVFVSGVTDEGLPSLLMAVLVVLLPRPGVVALSMLTVFALNGIVSGQFGLISVLFVAVSIALNEGLLAAFGVTVRRGNAVAANGSSTWKGQEPRARIALAIGIANGATMFVQYCLFEVLYKLQYDDWYVAAVTLIPGLLYGTIGAGLGAALGYRLRRTAL